MSRLGITPTLALTTSVVLALGAIACSSDDSPAGTPGAGGASDGSGGETASGGKSTSGSGGKASGGAAGSSSGGKTGSGGETASGGTASTLDGGPDAMPGSDGGDGCTPTPLVRPTVDPSIEVDEAATLVQRFHAEGTQNYTCAEVTGAPGTYSWGSSVPEAVLFAECGGPIGTHFGGPTWKNTADESTIVGNKLAAFAVAGTIPWLKLDAKSNTGTGMFSEVTFVQRVDTTGGVAPTDTCDLDHVGTVVKVPYTATYYFYTGPADAGH